jgi:alpha-tubulin suppressor-like RCC1 family protein
MNPQSLSQGGLALRFAMLALLPLLLAQLAACAPEASLSPEGSADIAVSAQALSTSEVTRVTLTVSGADISPSIISNLQNTAGQWRAVVGAIPSGTNRTFLAQAYDASNTKVYEGQATGVTISSATTASVVILLQQSTAPVQFINSAPKVTSLSSSADHVDFNQSLSLTVSAVDADADGLSYAWTATGGTFANGNTATPTWTAPVTEGTYTLSVSITDGRGGQAGISLKVAVAHERSTANVSVAFNAWPVATQVTGTPSGQVAPGGSVSLNVAAVDADNDSLSYSWSDDCSGSFSDTTVQNPSWSAPTSAAQNTVCTVKVTLNDGRGGSTKGQLGINIGLPPVATAPPVIDQLFQSTDTVAVNGTVDLLVSAHDPEGAALTFTWSTTGGTLGNPTTTASQSSVRWTAPISSGAFTVSVVVKDTGGTQTTQPFSITVPAAVINVSGISGGDNHTALLKKDGTLWTTGRNTYGELGDGTNTTRNTFTQVLTGVARVTATCNTINLTQVMAVKTDGTLWATGSNNAGELGTGTNIDRNTFGQVLTSVSNVSVGAEFTMAVKTDGTLWATGDNSQGQLGNGTATGRNTFGQVLTNVASVSTGLLSTLALKKDGTLWATGFNADGELGNGTNTNRNTFVQVLAGVSSVSAGAFHTVALKTDGTLWATGANTQGQLGDGTNTAHNAFVQVMTGVSSVSTGWYYTLALKTDGTLWATGLNSDGELGDGTKTNRNTFVPVLSGVLSISAGGVHAFALKADGTLWATGDNSYGQLGDGTNTSHTTFVQVPIP